MGYIMIYAKVKAKVGTKEMICKSIIRGGISLTSYSDEQTMKITFEKLKQQGRNPEIVEGMIAEKYDGMKAHEIQKKIISDIESLKENVRRFCNVTYNVQHIK